MYYTSDLNVEDVCFLDTPSTQCYCVVKIVVPLFISLTLHMYLRVLSISGLQTHLMLARQLRNHSLYFNWKDLEQLVKED